MKKNRCILLISLSILFFVLINISVLAQLLWPLNPDNVQHRIVGNIGEIRTTSNPPHSPGCAGFAILHLLTADF